MTSEPSPAFKQDSDNEFALAAVRSVALLGRDFPGLRPAFAIEQGQNVAAGELLFTDRRRPEIRHVAPVAGRIRDISRGARRSLDALVIDIDGDASRTFSVPEAPDRQSLIALLLESGLWPSLRARPFGRIADPAGRADALFITAIDTAPQAPDPVVVIRAHRDDFVRGAVALAMLPEGTTWVCKAKGADIPDVAGTRPADFSGAHPMGLPGTHIHKLHPVGRGRLVWQIGYQDVIALGHLLRTGRIWGERVISVADTTTPSHELVRAPLGASLRDLTAGRIEGTPRLLSGSALDGHPYHYLSRYHLQVSALPHRAPLGEPAGPLAKLRRFLARRPDALVPNAAHERAAPAGILAVPFLRAISIGDVETAERLGALELVEEDMALLSGIDGFDYGALLRRTLDDLKVAS